MHRLTLKKIKDILKKFQPEKHFKLRHPSLKKKSASPHTKTSVVSDRDQLFFMFKKCFLSRQRLSINKSGSKDRNFVANIPAAEKARSASVDLGGRNESHKIHFYYKPDAHLCFQIYSSLNLRQDAYQQCDKADRDKLHPPCNQ